MAYQETYQYAWVVYLLASLGMYYVVVKFIGKVKIVKIILE